jgi:hypothetical protein
MSKNQEYKMKKLEEFLKAWYREFSKEWTHIDDVINFDLFEAVGYKGLWWYIINKTNYLDDKRINAGRFLKISRSGLWFIKEEE